MFTRRDATVTPSLADDLIETYVAWREECGRVARSYGDWRVAPRAERPLSFAAYVAALDGEDCAAAAYRELVEQAGGRVCSWSVDDDGLVQS
jgi:hypothetical protein